VGKSSTALPTLETVEFWSDHAWHSELYWWRCNLPGFGWCHLHAHYPGECVSILR
jgi:hypothetical protein